MARLDDGSIENSDGKITFVSIERFSELVCSGTVCFVCTRNIGEGDGSEERLADQIAYC
jgi:hypothetical protein